MSREVDLLSRDLVRLLTDLGGLYAELGMHMRNKLDAMKQADSDRIQSITARETTIAERAGEREGLRRQITSRILAALGRAETNAQGRPVTLNELAEYLSEPRRSQLLVAAAGLREKVHEIDRLRTTMSMFSKQMLEHLGEVVRVMSAGISADVYSRTGKRMRSSVSAVFEAVG